MKKITLDCEEDFLVYREGSGHSVEIFDIQVKSERRVGKGRMLMELLFSGLKPGTKVWAITRAENEIAQEFYESLGFRVVGVLREFYADEPGVDAIMYGRKAGGSA